MAQPAARPTRAVSRVPNRTAVECSCGLLHDERLLVQDAVDGGAGDAVASGQLTETLPALAIAEDRRPVQFEWLASDMSTFESSAARAGADPLDDQTSLQLVTCPRKSLPVETGVLS
jgi:hypothetical protein